MPNPTRALDTFLASRVIGRALVAANRNPSACLLCPRCLCPVDADAIACDNGHDVANILPAVVVEGGRR